MNRIYVPTGPNIGNTMFMYMFGMLLNRLTGIPLHVRGDGLAAFGIRGKSTLEQVGHRCVWRLLRTRKWWIRHPEDLVQRADELRDGRHIITYPVSATMQIAYYTQFREEINAAFGGTEYERGYGDDHLVIHVRLGDIAKGRHANYSPLPISWYRHLERRTGRRLVFVGQLDEKHYCSVLRTHFPSATFLSPRTPAEDFKLIRNSTNVAISVSTFAYLATWLSDRVENIFMPVWGMFDPTVRKDVALIPPRTDPRYTLYEFSFEKQDANEPGNVLTDMDYQPFQRLERLE